MVRNTLRNLALDKKYGVAKGSDQAFWKFVPNNEGFILEREDSIEQFQESGYMLLNKTWKFEKNQYGSFCIREISENKFLRMYGLD